MLVSLCCVTKRSELIVYTLKTKQTRNAFTVSVKMSLHFNNRVTLQCNVSKTVLNVSSTGRKPLFSYYQLMANVSLAPAQLVKNGCFPLVLNLLPDRIDWNGNPPSWPRLVQNKNSSFFTARSNSPSFHVPGNKEQFADFCFLICPGLIKREIIFVTFGWRIVNSTTFRLHFP